jgi:excisionase family DNA binding protein
VVCKWMTLVSDEHLGSPMAKTSKRGEPTEPLAYSVTDAASASGLGRSTLYDLMAEGQLDYVKVRARRLITRQALEALLERHRTAT